MPGLSFIAARLRLSMRWGRTGQDLLQELQSRGHVRDLDVGKCFAFRDPLTLQNFAEAADFHPTDGPVWGSLKRAQTDLDAGANS
jgi:hypothetical protein